MGSSVLPGVIEPSDAGLHAIFLDQLKKIPFGERIKRCIQCGTCTGSCPVSHAMDLSPRQVIALFRAGEMEEILRSRTIWICASCYACTTRCPAGIRITDAIYALKRTAMERGLVSVAPQVQRLARLFTAILIRFGRLHEGSLIAGYRVRTSPLKIFSILPLAMKMLRTKRIGIFPHRIRGHAALARIIRKGEQIDMRHLEEELTYAPDYVGYRSLGEFQCEQRKGT